MTKVDSAKRGVSKRGKCRIIAGKWRGRIIKFDDAEGLRPTTDRIRETVFSWLQTYLPQSRCLDCFAGSGVLGFEALSRGAGRVVFLEHNKRTVNNLKESASILAVDAHKIAIKHEDALSWLQSVRSNKSSDAQFDLVFLDPPFHSDLLIKSCTLLNNSGCLAEDAIIYIEHAVNADVEMPDNWVCLKEKNSGQVAYKLFIYKSLT
ncbi:MAG: 16S rRNA (guanine(966)-N(2))-methyltransferase RsmD [Gammaproteobacteria bacterium]|nr:16S rRNA (guanine(966)-N(2))-methyltransferase RsmD [Gammaproteobacteria bacterium]